MAGRSLRRSRRGATTTKRTSNYNQDDIVEASLFDLNMFDFFLSLKLCVLIIQIYYYFLDKLNKKSYRSQEEMLPSRHD